MRTWWVILTLCFFLPGCTFSYDWVQKYRAERAIERQDYEAAIPLLREIIRRNPDSARALEAARQGARVAQFEAKNYPAAVEFYRQIVLSSFNAEERKSAQKYIAQIQFENLKDFDQAVLEYEKLLKLDHQPAESFRFRLNLAKSQLQLNNIDQAVSELDILLEQKHSPEELFEAKILKANTLIAAKRLPEAAQAWQQILKEFPDKSKKENVALNLVVCYEDMKEFNKAIEVLEGMREGYPQPKFLDARIQRLRDRMGNQPGAGGLRR